MATIQELYDRGSGEAIYPKTITGAVIDGEGRDLETRLAHEADELNRTLGGYVTTEAMTEALGKKQDSFSTSSDFTMSGGVLRLVDAAKLALFDMQWEAAGGTVIVSGVTYGLNGLNDITLAEALRIYSLFPLCESRMSDKLALFSNTRNVRTLFPVTLGFLGDNSNMSNCFRESREIEVLAIKGGHMVADCSRAFYNCNKLRTIIGRISLVNPSVGEMFAGCGALEDVQIWGLTCSISFSGSPKLSFASMEYIVRGASNTKAITIWVHPDVYAKLSGDTSNAAAAALTDEELTQWQQVCADAIAKNISFATV